MANQDGNQAGTVNAALSGDNIAVFGGNFIFNQYPSGQRESCKEILLKALINTFYSTAPAVILTLHKLLDPSRINTKLWPNSKHYDNYKQLLDPSVMTKLIETLDQKYNGTIDWDTSAHKCPPERRAAYRATVVNIAKDLSDEKSLLGTILIPDWPHLSDPYHVITTFAFQIALNIPGVAEYIVETIESVPWIHELDATTQIASLITNPLIRATENQHKSDDLKWVVVDEGLLYTSAGLFHREIITELSKETTKEKININIGFLLISSTKPPLDL